MDHLALSTLGQHLQRLRQERGLSLSQLAAAAGIAKSNLSRLEQGNGNPTLDTIWRLAVQLNMPFGTLVAPITVPLGEDGVQVRLIDQGQEGRQVFKRIVRSVFHCSSRLHPPVLSALRRMHVPHHDKKPAGCGSPSMKPNESSALRLVLISEGEFAESAQIADGTCV